MILVIWACMVVFYIVFFSLLLLVGAGYLLGAVIQRRHARIRPVPGGPPSRGIRPAYT